MSERLDSVRQICADITRRVDRSHIAEAGRKNEHPRKLWDLWAETGLFAMGLPEEYGGVSGGLHETILAIDLLAQHGLVLPTITPNFMSRVPVSKHGTDEQKKTYLPKTTTGEAYFSFAITEPDAGTNTFKIRTRATKQTDGSFLVNGTKHFISGFVESDYCLLVARTGGYDASQRTSGLTLFIIDPKSPGITTTLMDIGLHLAEKQYIVNFNDVHIPADAILGKEGRGIEVLFDCLNPERMLVSARIIGLSDYVLRKASDYAKVRAPFDAPIGAYQSIQHPLAIAKVHVEGARSLLYDAVQRYDAGENVGLQVNITKYLATEGFTGAVNGASAVYGGSFADMVTDFIPFYLQAKMSEIAPVNNNIVLNFIAQKALGLPKSY